MAGTIDKDFYTTHEVAERFGCKRWQVQRIFEDGLLKEPPRIRNYRAIPKKQLPAIEKVLRKRGYLKDDANDH